MQCVCVSFIVFVMDKPRIGSPYTWLHVARIRAFGKNFNMILSWAVSWTSVGYRLRIVSTSHDTQDSTPHQSCLN